MSSLEKKKEKMASVPNKSQTFLSEKIIINKTETETLAGLPLKAHIRAHISPFQSNNSMKIKTRFVKNIGQSAYNIFTKYSHGWWKHCG